MTPQDRSDIVKRAASAAGFELCAIGRIDPLSRQAYLKAWLGSGRAGSMDYLHRNLKLRADPRELLADARSVIVVGLSYGQNPGADPVPDRGPRGRVAMYAWGDDYHEVVKCKLRRIADRLRAVLDVSFDSRVCVDTAPIVERELAAAAGLGWIGKNTMVLHPRRGSYFFLGELLTTLDLAPDEPVADHCGSCTACLDACPTQAFPAPYEMDASRCISYLTIEHRGDISSVFQEKMGDWVFGCDVCQEVCPFNRGVPKTSEPRFSIRELGPAPVLEDILNWTEDDYRTQLRGSAMKRAKFDMLQRNARIAHTNSTRGTPEVS